jgi:hypothetical protein
MTWRLGVIALAIAGVASVTGEAGAQTVTAVPTEADHWPCQPGCRLVESDELRVTDADGIVGQGRLRAFDAASIHLTKTDGGEVVIERDRVRRIDRRGDRLLNGILIGAAFGLGTIAAADPMGADVGAADYIGSTALWAGLGALFDHLHKGWTRVYDRPPTGSGDDKGSHAFWIAPSPRGLRVGFSKTF